MFISCSGICLRPLVQFNCWLLRPALPSCCHSCSQRISQPQSNTTSSKCLERERKHLTNFVCVSRVTPCSYWPIGVTSVIVRVMNLKQKFNSQFQEIQVFKDLPGQRGQHGILGQISAKRKRSWNVDTGVYDRMQLSSRVETQPLTEAHSLKLTQHPTQNLTVQVKSQVSQLLLFGVLLLVLVF